jgi:hypothetical protein
MTALHVALILIHASAATVAFVLGLLLCARVPDAARSARFAVYAICVWTAVLTLITVVLVDWGRLDPVRHIAFSVLGVLGVYLIWRTERARRQLRGRPQGWQLRFVGHVGFVLISLFDGFCIVLAIDLGMPGWVVASVAVLGVAVGVIALRARARGLRVQQELPEG